METNRVVVNTDTGEEEYKLKEGDRIVSSEKVKYVSEHVMNFNANEPFVKLYTRIVPILRKHLTPGEFTFLISLSEFVSYDDGIIRNCSHGNCNVVNQKELAELLDIPYGNVRQFMRKLMNKGVIASVKTGYIYPDEKERYTNAYVVNPYIFFRGVDANKKILKTFFDNTGWKEILTDIDIEK